MPESESDIQNAVRLALSQAGARVFRNHVGKYRTADGRVYSHGLVVGSSDLIGWVPVAGRAVFLAVEIKTPTGRATTAQLNFINRVNADGGVAFIATSADGAIQTLKELTNVTGRRNRPARPGPRDDTAAWENSDPQSLDHTAQAEP